MLKPYSTKRPRPIPPEFEEFFIRGGWSKVNQAFGKRPSVRYFTALGGTERFGVEREAERRKKNACAVRSKRKPS